MWRESTGSEYAGPQRRQQNGLSVGNASERLGNLDEGERNVAGKRGHPDDRPIRGPNGNQGLGGLAHLHVEAPVDVKLMHFQGSHEELETTTDGVQFKVISSDGEDPGTDHHR